MTGAVAASVTDVATYQRERFGRGLLVLMQAAQPRAAVGISSDGLGDEAGWKIQVGTFRSRAGAIAKLKSTATSVPELEGFTLQPEPYGAWTRARVTGFPDGQSARTLCASVAASGTGCYVVAPR